MMPNQALQRIAHPRPRRGQAIAELLFGVLIL